MRWTRCRWLRRGLVMQRKWLARRLCISEQQVGQVLAVLEATEQVQRSSRGYSVRRVQGGMVELHDLHLQYVRAMQEVIARSEPSECVGLYCSQLLDLGEPAQNH